MDVIIPGRRGDAQKKKKKNQPKKPSLKSQKMTLWGSPLSNKILKSKWQIWSVGLDSIYGP